jgi:hypothetical protein
MFTSSFSVAKDVVFVAVVVVVVVVVAVKCYFFHFKLFFLLYFVFNIWISGRSDVTKKVVEKRKLKVLILFSKK